MAGWTTLRVTHAPTHSPSAAHKLRRARPQAMQKNKKYKQYPARRSGIAGPTTSAKEAANPSRPHSFLQSQARNPAPSPRLVTFAEIRTARDHALALQGLMDGARRPPHQPRHR